MLGSKPQFACDIDLSKIIYPVWGFPKIDGVRIVNLTGKATSRTLMPHANIFTTERFSAPIYLGIDGEGAVGEPTSSSLCRDTTSALNTIKGEPNIHWHAFDFLREDVVNLLYMNRYKALVEYVKKYKPDGVSVIDYVVLKNEAQLKSFYKKCLDLNYEGIVVRDPYGKHKDGRCNANEGAYLRMKPSSDKEALVIGFDEAKANLNAPKKNALGYQERSSHKENKVGKGMIGTIYGKDLTTESNIDIGPGKMTHKERIFYYNNPDKIIGKYIKYRSLDTGVKDAPRHARYISFRSKEDIAFE